MRQPAEPQELARELAAIQSVILRNMRELSALIHDGNDPRMARAAGELGAAVESWKRQHRRFSPRQRLSTTAHVLSPLYWMTITTTASRTMCRITWSDLRGVQFPGSRGPAHRQGDRNADDGRRATRGNATAVPASPNRFRHRNPHPRRNLSMVRDAALGHASQIDIDAVFA